MGNTCQQGAVVIPAPQGPAAPAPIDEKELAERAARLATELFEPLETSVLSQLNELVDPAYLKTISVPGAVAAQLVGEQRAQDREREAVQARRGAEQTQRSAETAQAGAERARERAEAAEARAREQAEKAQKVADVARSEAAAARAEAEAARLERDVLAGKLADAEAKLAKLAAATPS